ncbi:MAG: hypothetical protein AB7O62_12360 [Pirellulales bacterium]
MVVLAAGLLAGCSLNRPRHSTAPVSGNIKDSTPCKPPPLYLPERIEEGYTLILPGAWGDLPPDYGIAKGLEDADVRSAVELYDWTASPWRIAHNIRNAAHNRDQALAVADKVVQYQDQYPGRPVHLIGYSGGGGLLIQALEALPENRRIECGVLLAPDLSANYDLRAALAHTRRGIHNFYSPFDVPVLMVMGTAVGTTDGRHALPGGAIGFYPPRSLDADERSEYASQVAQCSYAVGMLRHGHRGGHFGWTNRSFVANRVAPLIERSPVNRLPPIEPQLAHTE